MDFIVTDRETIVRRGVIVHSAYVIISIHDADKQPAQIPRRVGMRAVLSVCFDDAVPEPGSQRRLMTAEDAMAIWSFVQEYRDDIGAIVCHCEQGMSRSPAVAAALAELLGEDSTWFFQAYQPNEYVYRLMSEVEELG